MLERLVIKNFQAHEKLDLKLDPNCTTIVGRSDAGKSSVLRSLGWIAFNRPQGKAFIRKGSKKASATLYVDGHKITRIKGENKNLYKLDGLTLKAFGSQPPREVSTLFNIDSLNVQSQHDPLFWFSLSPGQVAKELNSVVDLSVIDKSLSYIASQSRANKAEIQVVEKRLQEAQGRVKALRPVLGAKNALGRLVSRQETISEERDRIGLLRKLVEQGEEVSKTVGIKIPDISGLERDWKALLESRVRVKDLANRISVAEQAEERIKKTEKELKETESKLGEWKECPVCRQPLP